MLKYYSYYNVGGYKDMFLGDSSMNAKETYYLPLLAIWKKKATSGDKNAESKLKSIEGLTKIQLLSSNDCCGLPQEAEPMFSHGGYKVVYTTGANGESIFAIRDIESESKDESGRTLPFLLVIAGTTDKDAKILEKVAAYASSRLESFSSELSRLFYYNAEINGVVFNLSAINSIVTNISEEGNNNLLTSEGVHTIESKRGLVSLLVLPEGISKEMAVSELNLHGKTVRAVSINQILPFDNQKKLVATLRGLKDVKNSIYTDKRVHYLIGGAFVLGFIIGYFLGKS